MDKQEIRRAQIEAGERLVIDDMRRKGLVPIEETPGDRHEREKLEAAEQRKASALRVLAPLGFEDSCNGECAGAIHHSGAGLTLDASTLHPAQVVHELLRIGSERGVAALRRDLRAAIGL